MRAYGHGDLVAASVLQPGLERFDDGHGSAFFVRVLGRAVVLGAPLAPRGDRARVADAFLAREPNALFCYVREDFLDELDEAPGSMRARGLFAGGMGEDVHVDADRLVESPPRDVASASKKAARAGLRLEPFAIDRLDDEGRARLAAIDAAYLARSECRHEMRFLAWPLRADDPEASVRRTFFLSTGTTPRFGYVALNPVFEAGRVTGYLLDIVRFFPTKLWGLYLAVAREVARLLRGQGLALELGFCPLVGLAEAPVGRSRALAFQLRLARRFLRVPFVENLAASKRRLADRVEPRFFVGRSRNLPRSLALFLGAQGVSPRQVFGEDLLRAAIAGARRARGS